MLPPGSITPSPGTINIPAAHLYTELLTVIQVVIRIIRHAAGDQPGQLCHPVVFFLADGLQLFCFAAKNRINIFVKQIPPDVSAVLCRYNTKIGTFMINIIVFLQFKRPKQFLSFPADRTRIQIDRLFFY